MKNLKRIHFLLFFVLVCSVWIYCSSNTNHLYNSHCLKPVFSPDEKQLVYWDTINVDNSIQNRKYILYLYSLENKKKERILVRHFKKKVLPIWLFEMIQKIEIVQWSNDGKYIAVSLTGRDVEILDVKSRKIVSKLDFSLKHNGFIAGYFYLKWFNSNSLTVGYFSENSNLSKHTNDTFGLIRKKGNRFVIESALLKKDSSFMPDLSYLNFNNKNRKKDLPCYVLLRKNTDGRLSNIESIRQSLTYPSEILELPKVDSRQRVIISQSISGKFAIISGIRKKVKKRGCDFLIELVDVPLHLRSKLVDACKK